MLGAAAFCACFSMTGHGSVDLWHFGFGSGIFDSRFLDLTAVYSPFFFVL